MRFGSVLPLLVSPCLAVAGCGIGTAPQGSPTPTGTPLNQLVLPVKDAGGATVAHATLTPEGNGVRIHVEALHLSPGAHGLHVHSVGKCEAPDFISSGPHFNPFNKRHGIGNPEGAHAGDLPSLPVGTDGKGSVEFVADQVTLAAGKPNSLRGGQTGTSLIIHADPDDERTDPSGNSGNRIACAVIGTGPGPFPTAPPPPTQAPPPPVDQNGNVIPAA